ncbi:MAG: universal stress protein [Gaiellaceae bacterium]|jgi:nucleotide-binding universal stress UspA family protein
MKTIIVGYDDTEPAKRALTRTAELAVAFKAQIVVISAAPALTPASHGFGPVHPTDSPEFHREQLEQAATLLEERGVEAEYRVALGDPPDAILQLADELGADMIVVGSRELSFIQRLVGQSVSEAVQRKAHCDVLIVH